MKMTLSNQLPEYPVFAEGIRRAPDRGYTLSPAQTVTALKNALRYIPVELHRKLAPEFLEELRTRGRIYGYIDLELRNLPASASQVLELKECATTARLQP